jgi:hypothetical protein
VWGRGPAPYPGDIPCVTYTAGGLAPDTPVALLDQVRDLGRQFE